MVSLFAFIFVTQVFAATINEATVDQPVCFGREYSEAHMNKNPLQTVKALSLKFAKYDLGEGYSMEIDAQIKRTEYVTSDDGAQQTVVSYKPYTSGMQCLSEGKNLLRCYIECDGGSAFVSWKVSSAKDEILFTNNGFQVYGGCGEDELDEANWVWLEAKKGGDDVFKLYAIPAQYCQN